MKLFINSLYIALLSALLAPISLLAQANINPNWWREAPYKYKDVSDQTYTFDEEYMTDKPFLYLPQTKQEKLPAIIVIHGFMGSKMQMDPTAQQLAKHGFIVLSYTAIDQGQPFQWFDGLIAAYHILEGENRRPHSPLYQRVDLENIGLLGHSMGGTAVLHAAAMAKPNGLRGKIKTVASMMPYHGCVSDFNDKVAGGKDKLGSDISAMPYPVLIISGEVDGTNEPVGGYEYFQSAKAKGSIFMSLKGVNHTNWTNSDLFNRGKFPVAMPIITAWFITQLTDTKSYQGYFQIANPYFEQLVQPNLKGRGKPGEEKFFPPFQIRR